MLASLQFPKKVDIVELERTLKFALVEQEKEVSLEMAIDPKLKKIRQYWNRIVGQVNTGGACVGYP